MPERVSRGTCTPRPKLVGSTVAEIDFKPEEIPPLGSHDERDRIARGRRGPTGRYGNFERQRLKLRGTAGDDARQEA